MTTQSPRSRVVPWLPLAMPALVWSAQGVLGWYVMAHACAEAGPGATGLTPGSARIVVGAFTVLALIVTVLSLGRSRRRMRSDPEAGVGEQKDLDEYLAAAGFLVATTLTLGIVLAGLSLVFIAHCGVAR